VAGDIAIVLRGASYTARSRRHQDSKSLVLDDLAKAVSIASNRAIVFNEL